MNLKRVSDETTRERQLKKSLEVWESRLKDDPDNPKIKKMVEERKKAIESLGGSSNENKKEIAKEVKELTEEVPTIKNAADLYKYASSRLEGNA